MTARRYLSPTTFTGRETLFLLNLAKRGGWHRDSYASGVRRTEQYDGSRREVCPLCAYANAKAGEFVGDVVYWSAAVQMRLPAYLSGRGRRRIVSAADNPHDPRHPELLRLLGVGS